MGNRERDFSENHLLQLDKAIRFCEKSSRDLSETSNKIKGCIETINSELTLEEDSDYVEFEKKEFINKLYEEKGNIEYINFDLEKSHKQIDKFIVNIDEKKQKLKELKNEAQRYYSIKFDSNRKDILYTNLSSTKTGFSKILSKIRDKNNERKIKKINKWMYKQELLYPEEILNNEFLEGTEAYEIALKNHKARIDKLKRNIAKCIILGSVKLVLKVGLPILLAYYFPFFRSRSDFCQNLIVDSIVDFIGKKFEKILKIEKFNYRKAGVTGYITLFKDLKTILENDKKNLTRENIVKSLENLLKDIKTKNYKCYQEFIRELSNDIKAIEDFEIDVDDIVQRFNKVKNKLFVLNKELQEWKREPIEYIKTKRKYNKLTKTTRYTSFLEKIKFTWWDLKDSGKRSRIIKKIILTSASKGIGFFTYTLKEYIIYKGFETFKNFVGFNSSQISGGILKIFGSRSDFIIKNTTNSCEISKTIIRTLKEEFSSVIVDTLEEPVKNMFEFIPKVLLKFIDKDDIFKSYSYDPNNANFKKIVYTGVDRITGIYKKVINNYGRKYLKT